MKNAVRKVVIPVAGLGTRGLPFTKEVPKEMLPIIDVPAVQFIVEEVLAAGIEQVIFVSSKGKSILEDYFDPSPNLENRLRKKGKDALADQIKRIGSLCEVVSVRQKEPLGLGHAVLCARSIVGNEKFSVCLGDEIFPPWDDHNQKEPALKKLVRTAEEVGGSVIGVMEVSAPETSSYGIIDIKGQTLSQTPMKVLRTVEKPKPENAPSRYAIIGRYVFEPLLFDYLKETKPGVGGEIQLTDAMDKVCQDGKLYSMLIEGCRYDIGSQLAFVKAQVDCALRRPELAEAIKAHLRSVVAR